MTRARALSAVLAIGLGACKPKSGPLSGCEDYASALEACMEELGVGPGPALSRRLSCASRDTSSEADDYYHCMAGALRDGSCGDGGRTPLSAVSERMAACPPLQRGNHED